MANTGSIGTAGTGMPAGSSARTPAGMPPAGHRAVVSGPVDTPSAYNMAMDTEAMQTHDDPAGTMTPAPAGADELRRSPR